ncbi:D-arabinose 1-dehydrogenase-like Zn-dependent alcohol dehydrogenase [Actinomycetospora succinea]|uniref:alcohol dehydrogenase n=1 Tax=Actinomycetospora succinea TaxID=663603 RepID=A0A4R6VH45_9PSEU|nr:alcohol dehydrogenase catalytic domain-containing protein [Actinomycetospora succinea]TDQ62537.1 D-arabinose 1-dehydrogenase-like Zn-dependent alcohol dehydrogenase [Actinomycetospora succinea]
MPTLSASPVPAVWPRVPPEVPRTMSAVVLDRFGPPDVLTLATVPTPEPGPGDVLVRVAAVCVGRFLDVSLRAGRHPVRPALPHVLGVEHAGTVVAVGADVRGIDVGQHVAVWPVLGCGDCAACADGAKEACPRLHIAGVHGPGAYAEYTAVPAAAIWAIPDDLDPATAAGVALAGPVAMNQLRQAGLRQGDWVLVVGAASALGSTTAELARHLGARVIGTSRSGWKRERLLGLGLEAALDPMSDSFVDDVRALTGGAGVAVAVDDLGEPEIFGRVTDVLAPRGTVVSSGAFLGGTVPLNLARLYTLNQRVLGVRTGNDASAEALWAEVGRGFRPVVDRAFPLEAAAVAHRFLEADDNMGRIVLTTAAADNG